jgi:pyridoxal phosphate enzyme (YggS family)
VLGARERIEAALRRAGRPAGSARLLAVSKTKPLSAIAEAAAAGQTEFGENYAQEAAAKIDAFPGLRFHFIGSLQSNKARLVVGRVAMIHSVDRLKLAREIAQIASRLGQRQDALIQLRIGDEQTKSGATLEAALEIAREAPALAQGLRFRGIMCLPPLAEAEADGRAFFREARAGYEELRGELAKCGHESAFDELSMGTSHDYEGAILEGATLVRIGTDIFGAREAATKAEGSPKPTSGEGPR